MKNARIVFWVLAVSLGLAQTWGARHVIFSDGISYIEIAKAYLNGDWDNAINPYWSPLYSWLLALAYLVLRPSAYWEVATLHLVNFAEYLLCLIAGEFLLTEMLRFRKIRMGGSDESLPDSVVYIGGYCTILFAGLSMVTMWYCSPDMISMALLFALSALLLRVSTLPVGTWTFLAIGAVCGLSFLARTAFAPTFVVCLSICALLLYLKGRDVWKPVLLILGCVLAICAPFVIAISIKAGKPTIGESGPLNYGWEVDGAARYAHWQGEPYDIGRPKHPTTQMTTAPRSYAFPEPIAGTYPPWFNPAYWYDGIRPKLKIRPQLQVLVLNLSVLANLGVRSAVFLSVVILLLFTGLRRWFARMLEYWPILVPSLTVLGLYCLVYVEKRYIAGNLVILWMAALASIKLSSAAVKRWASQLVVLICLFYTMVFVVRRQAIPFVEALSDLVHFRERYQNVEYLIAQEMKRVGLKPGDKIAYIGPAVDADWARLANVKIVAEIPLVYERHRKLLNNTLDDRADDIRQFWTAGAAKQREVLRGFRKAGARMLVVDGYYERRFVSNWARALPAKAPFIRKDDPRFPGDLNTRYKWLTAKDDEFRPPESALVR